MRDMAGPHDSIVKALFALIYGVRPTRDNGLLVLDALTEFGAPVELAPEQFESPSTLLVLGREPFRVDILTSIREIIALGLARMSQVQHRRPQRWRPPEEPAGTSAPTS